MEMQRVVLKFGGSVISDETAVIRVADVVKDLSIKYKIVAIVVSAMGKTTNNLDAMARRVANDPAKSELDVLLATGEMQSAALLAMRLKTIGISAISFNAWQFGIITDRNHGNAQITHIREYMYADFSMIPVITGFQGITIEGSLTTLGREGSDISAVMIAEHMKADFCWFFKNGGGIHDKNPNKNKDAKLLKCLSYKKMLHIINNGRGQVLHQKSVEIARKQRIPLFISGLDDPYVGTWICSSGRVPKIH